MDNRDSNTVCHSHPPGRRYVKGISKLYKCLKLWNVRVKWKIFQMRRKRNARVANMGLSREDKNMFHRAGKSWLSLFSLLPVPAGIQGWGGQLGMRVGVPGTRLLWIPFRAFLSEIPSGKDAVGQRCYCL